MSAVIYEEDGPIGRITLNRPMLDQAMLGELMAVLARSRLETRTRVLVITGAGDRFFCIGGDKDGLEPTHAYPGVLPVVDLYEVIDKHPKPIIASVNGFAVGAGHVLHVVCDLTIAKESAIFRQVGPMVGSFDAGFGTWYLEDLVGRKRAKEIWYLNDKLTAARALELGLVNRVVPDADLRAETEALALRIAQRGTQAIAALKASFAARSQGVAGFSRIAHDHLLRYYLDSGEASELARAFAEKREPDTGAFGK